MNDGPSILNQHRVVPGGRPPNSDFHFDWPYERPLNNPAIAEIWCYTPQMSYVAGDVVDLHVHTTRPAFDVEIYRDGPRPETVHTSANVPGTVGQTSADAHVTGCDWPVALHVTVADDWKSGFYVVVVRVTDDDGAVFEREHFFVVRATVPASRTSLAFIVSTGTMCAYNDWGGGNCYHGPDSTPRDRVPCPRTSTRRPFARGMIRLPADAPRAGYAGELRPFEPPHYPQHAWAHHHGYARDYGDSSWALYGRLFVVWAEQQGYTLDYVTMHDLHADPDALAPYRCSIIAGHDEYMSWEMREAIERQLQAGGNHARFAGNMLWQIRMEDDGATFVVHKNSVTDPMAQSDTPQRTTDLWDSPTVGWPAAATFGLTGSGIVHVMYGAAAPRSSAGFTIYRPWHWSLEGTDLYYGDLVGGRPDCIVRYEVDGCDYTMTDGLPYPTGRDGAPNTLQIIGMCPGIRHEEDHFSGTVRMMNAESNLPDLPEWRLSEHESVRHPRYGAAMMASHDRGIGVGDGTVFVAGTTDWVVGLERRNFFVEQITRNVLDRLGGDAPT